MSALPPPSDARLTKEEALALFRLWHGAPEPPEGQDSVPAMRPQLETDPGKPGLHALPAHAAELASRSVPAPLPEIGPVFRPREVPVPQRASIREEVARVLGQRPSTPYS